MSQIVLDSVTPVRLCPGPGHSPGVRRHCFGKHCIEHRQGLLVLWWTEGALLTLPDVLHSFDGLRELSDGYALPLVVHLQKLAGIVPAAREALLDCSLSTRVSIVGSGPVDQVIAAFTEMGYSDTHYFESADPAEAWARGT